jgi:hypothetical protein
MKHRGFPFYGGIPLLSPLNLNHKPNTVLPLYGKTVLGYSNNSIGERMSARRKATFYVEERVHKALRLKAATDDMSTSDLLNLMLSENLQEYLEDLEDIADAKSRTKDKSGGSITLEQLKKKIKA